VEEVGRRPAWTVFTNHGLVLICLGFDPDARVRDIAATIGLTERAVQAILHDLVEANYITRTRIGRRNHYVIRREAPLSHPFQAVATVGDLLGAVNDDRSPPSASTGAGPHLVF
jgi:hypothetical protein